MASYHLSVQVIQRSAGRNAVAAAAYRAAARLSDRVRNETFDYRRKQGVEHNEIRAPDDAPDWAKNRSELWARVEETERRKDAQVAREIILALPHELDADSRLAMLREFVDAQFVKHGMVADIAVHAPHRRGDQRNHHAHIMLTLRPIEDNAFGKKERSWNQRGRVEYWRRQWANITNKSLEAIGSTERVDHRSFARRGIDREPQCHMGPEATALERKGLTSRRGNENRRIEEANKNRIEHAYNQETSTLAKMAPSSSSKRSRFLVSLDDANPQRNQSGRPKSGPDRAGRAPANLLDAQERAIADRLDQIGEHLSSHPPRWSRLARQASERDWTPHHTHVIKRTINAKRGVIINRANTDDVSAFREGLVTSGYRVELLGATERIANAINRNDGEYVRTAKEFLRYERLKRESPIERVEQGRLVIIVDGADRLDRQTLDDLGRELRRLKGKALVIRHDVRRAREPLRHDNSTSGASPTQVSRPSVSPSTEQENKVFEPNRPIVTGPENDQGHDI